ncbi:hypothetical protein GEMRC1_000015 [Eukaryota sp. GEM-RC1]
MDIKARLNQVLRLPGNQSCVDCGCRAPRWASTNLGIFFCMNCSAIHRSLGTHISKVKSCTLDEWTMNQVDFMHSIGGNAAFNAYYEAKLSKDRKITQSCSTDDRSSFIKNKYAKKLWYSDTPAIQCPSPVTAPSSPVSSPRGSPKPSNSPSMPSSNRSRSTLSTSQKREVNLIDTDSFENPPTSFRSSSTPSSEKSAFSFIEDEPEVIPSFVDSRSKIQSARASILSLFDD